MSAVKITTVGQELYFSSSRNRGHGSGTVKVEQLGRVWATLGNGYRAHILTGELDCGGFNSPGTLYENQNAYEAERQARIAFDAIRKEMGYRPKNGVTAADIRQAAALLKIELL